MARSEKWRAANAAAMRKLAQDPAWRAAHKRGVQKFRNNPEYSAKMSKKMKEVAKNRPAWRESMVQMEHLDFLSSRVSEAMSRPDVKKRHLDGTRAAMRLRDMKAEYAALQPLPEDLIIDLYQRGWTLSEIAREIGTRPTPKGRRNTGRIKTVLRHAGIFSNGRRSSKTKTRAAGAGR